jgi:hypothetical protein
MSNTRSPLSPMRRRHKSPMRHNQASPLSLKKMFASPTPSLTMVSDSEDTENSPLVITRNQQGLMKLTRSPYPKRSKVATKSQGTQSDEVVAAKIMSPEVEVETTLTMEHARQFRGLRMQLFQSKQENQQISEELTTYKTASMEVARQSRATRMAFHNASRKEVASIQQESQKFKEYAANVAEKLQSRLKRMVQAAQKSQTEVTELRARNDLLEQLLELEREEKTTDDTETNTMYTATAFIALFGSMMMAVFAQLNNV